MNVRALVPLLLLAVLPLSAFAATYDLAINNDVLTMNCQTSDWDTGTGGTQTVGPGDTVRIVGGVRSPLKLQDCIGTSGSRITFRNRASDGVPVTITQDPGDNGGADLSYRLSLQNFRYVDFDGTGGYNGAHVDECGFDADTQTELTDGCGFRIVGHSSGDDSPTNWVAIGGASTVWSDAFPIVDTVQPNGYAYVDNAGNMRDITIEGIEIDATFDDDTAGANIGFHFNDHDLCQSNYERRVFTVAGITTDPTVGAVYRNAGDTLRWTVTSETVSGGSGTVSTSLTTGSNADSVAASGTLTKISGTGDATIAYSVTTLNLRWRENVILRNMYIHDNTAKSGSGEGMYLGPNWLRTVGDNATACPDLGSGTVNGNRNSNNYRVSVTGITTRPLVGAVYTTNGGAVTVSVMATIAAGASSGTLTLRRTAGTAFPATTGTLAKTSGTGQASIAYTGLDRNDGDDEHRLRDFTVRGVLVKRTSVEGIEIKSCIDAENDCLITSNKVVLPGMRAGDSADGAAIKAFESEGVFVGNTVVDAGGNGLNWNTNNYTGDAGNLHAEARNNLIIRAGTGGDPNAPGSGISIGDSWYTTVRLWYNTIVGSEAEGISPGNGVSGLSVVGNISAENGNDDINFQAGGTYTDNLPDTTSEGTETTATDESDIGFADYLGGNYSIASSSPARDATSVNCPGTDILSVVRPVGADCDIGAYEYVAPDAPPSTTYGRRLIRGISQ